MQWLSLSRVFTIRTVESKTGLSQHTIRAWERRYGALQPTRTPTNRRIYGEDDVEKLTLLRAAVQAGHGISQVAPLTIEQLRALLSREGGLPHALPAAGDAEVGQALLSGCQRAAADYDSDGLSSVLTRGAALLGLSALVDLVIVPFMRGVGDKWEQGDLSISQEHLASQVVRGFLDRARTAIDAPPGSPVAVVATPAGEVHELGALIVAVTAAVQGWRVLYLGPDLPIEELVRTARQSHARLVCLSIVVERKERTFDEGIARLRFELGTGVAVVVGGRAAGSHSSAIERSGAKLLEDFGSFRNLLSNLRI